MKKIEDDHTLGLEPDLDAFSLPLDETGWGHEDETSQEVKERKEYLKNRVNPILEVMVADLMKERPKSVITYMTQWIQKKRLQSKSLNFDTAL